MSFQNNNVMNIQNDRDNLDSTQQAALQFVAGQCPLSGGDAVYQARAMLEIPEWIDDSQLCQFGRSAGNSTESEEDCTVENLDFATYPNPARGTVTISLNTMRENLVLVLSDLAGREVKRMKLDKALQKVIHLPGIEPGIYYLTLFEDGKQVKTEKLVFLK